MTLLLAVLIIVFGALAAMTSPKKGRVDLDGTYEQVSVKVTNVWSKMIGMKGGTTGFRQTRYYMTVEYDKQEYEMGPLSSAPYMTGGYYDMYLHDGKIYRSLDEVETSIRYDQALPIYRISLWIVFVSVILFIGYLTAFLQNR